MLRALEKVYRNCGVLLTGLGMAVLLTPPYSASALEPILAQAAPAEICPLPTEQNVSYASVLQLPAGQPQQVVSYGADPLQFAELWLPAVLQGEGQATSKVPLVALIHGGCWLNSFDVQHTHALSTALTAAGYAVWAIEYRRTGDVGGGWPGTFTDIVAALNALSSTSLPGIDLDKLAVVGHSAGGHLALLASEHKLKVAPSIAIGLAPIIDVAQYAQGDNSCQQATAKFIGGMPAEQPAAYHAATPTLSSTSVTQLAIHGDQDDIVPLAQSQKHLPTTVVKGAGHFDLIHPYTPAFQSLLRTLGEQL